MNQIENNLKQALHNAVQKAFDTELDTASIVIEIPKDKSHGDYSTNVAMQLTRVLKNNPRKIAEAVVEALDKAAADIESCEIAGPGFINFTIKNTSLAQIITRVLQEQDNYGNSNDGQGLKVNVEYVSANPTGDLHLGHARGAAWGDSITRLMKASGYDVCREYYVNDAGNQIVNLGKSLQARYREHLGLDFDLPEDGYHGEDVKNIAIAIAEEYKDAYVEYSDANLKFFKEKGIAFELDKIRRDLDNFRVHFDVWSSEQSIRDEGKVEKALEVLHEKGLTYEEDGALPAGPSMWDICLRSLVCGIGFGCFQSPNNREMLSNVIREHASYASGVLSIMRTFGQCLGAAAVAVLLAADERSIHVALWSAAAASAVSVVVSASRLRKITHPAETG